MTLDDRLRAIRASLAAAPQADSLRTRSVHVAVAEQELNAIESTIRSERVLVNAAKAELDRLAREKA